MDYALSHTFLQLFPFKSAACSSGNFQLKYLYNSSQHQDYLPQYLPSKLLNHQIFKTFAPFTSNIKFNYGPTKKHLRFNFLNKISGLKDLAKIEWQIVK